MTSYFSTSPNAKPDELASSSAVAPATSDVDAYSFEVVAGDYVPSAHMERSYRPGPYSSKPLYSDCNAGTRLPPFHQAEGWAPLASVQGVSGGALGSQGRCHMYGFSPVSDAPSYDVVPLNNHSPPLPPPPPINTGKDGLLHSHSDGGMNPYTYRGPNADYTSRKQNRLHQDFKALPKEERQRLVEREAATSDLLARTVHLRFLPLTMLQSELGAICSECGEYLRVRICGNSTNNQNWIYGFVEFATTAGAEAMMRRSGMELNNGPGRPPLRLKCNSAKQPIVDRVFHDADPTTGSPCIFGLGNFAKRTLGDALESYYNLKEKEAQQLQDPPATPFSASVSPGLTAAVVRQPVRLSPHARAFQPSSSPLLGAEYLPGVHRAAPGSTAGASNGDHWTPPSLSLAAEARRADSDAASTDSATGMVSTVTKHHTTGTPGALTSSDTPPCVTHSPDQDYSTFNTAVYSSGAASHAIPGHPATTNSVAARRRASSGSNAAATPLETVAAALSVSSDRVGSVLPDFLLPPSNAAAFPTHSDLAGNQLSLALQNMMLAGSATDGDEVLERGRELTLRAIGQAHCFLNSQQGFYDAMGTLRSLVELLDFHAAVTGGAGATGSGDHTAELPQRATQLRLLANLMMALLYMMKRNLSDALPHIHSVVMSCNDIPVVCLWKTQQQQQAVQQSSQQKANAGKPERLNDTYRWQGLAVGDDVYDKAEEAGGYGCFGAPASFLEAVLESMREEDNEHEEEAKNASASNSNNGDTASTSSAEAQALLRRDQNFHRYVLNVLVAIGLSMEEVHPVITRSAYALAAGRGRDVLGTASADLDECLESTAPNPNLCDRLYGPVSSTNNGNGGSNSGGRSKRDITFFPRVFFTTAEAMRQDVLRMVDTELFWQRLPPKQCVQCYIE
ncbi:conserved hypothetical protein [Leishmania mexicana MHOM/GT/2001/U1103]|uniref:RRM domain-containing protein n=1 Tax=Leishmania mexicana (strain MHOM/GT/2001/U1103) TaxID=929439 RepID=E9B1Q0_LEIMU|nr:conserved hypothetical protein [Leishmania mexicana MHOM/GT/2001/U1103]CBZ29157.1 conserved hypothetical protein [Leishmania mexicana MHOM/GT/2001/U1103]